MEVGVGGGGSVAVTFTFTIVSKVGSVAYWLSERNEFFRMLARKLTEKTSDTSRVFESESQGSYPGRSNSICVHH